MASCGGGGGELGSCDGSREKKLASPRIPPRSIEIIERKKFGISIKRRWVRENGGDPAMGWLIGSGPSGCVGLARVLIN